MSNNSLSLYSFVLTLWPFSSHRKNRSTSKNFLVRVDARCGRVHKNVVSRRVSLCVTIFFFVPPDAYTLCSVSVGRWARILINYCKCSLGGLDSRSEEEKKKRNRVGRRTFTRRNVKLISRVRRIDRTMSETLMTEETISFERVLRSLELYIRTSNAWYLFLLLPRALALSRACVNGMG